MELPEFFKKIDLLEVKYQEWAKPISHAIRKYGFGKNHDKVKAVRAAQLTKYDPYEEVYRLFDELCAFYLAADDASRDAVINFVCGKPGILHGLLGYIRRCAGALQSPADGITLRMGLAAASIENCSADARDTMLALASLYLAAEDAGLNPRYEFRATAKLSSAKASVGSSTSMREMLSNFSGYGVVSEMRKSKK